MGLYEKYYQTITVRELINLLLDCRMDARVTLFTRDPSRPECRGVGFRIDNVVGDSGGVEIQFTDWRDEEDKRERRTT